MKNILASKTVWGLIIAAAGAFGVGGTISADAASASTVDQVVQIVGLVLALYGRWKAGGLTLGTAKSVPPAA